MYVNGLLLQVEADDVTHDRVVDEGIFNSDSRGLEYIAISL